MVVVLAGRERLAVDAVHHASFLHSFTPGRGAAQAVHTDGEEQRRSLGCDVQNVANDGFFFNLNSHDYDLQFIFTDPL
jgi:hypothetical protein